MKEFDIEKAKAGAKVRTRDGRDVRIVCYDRIAQDCLVALIKDSFGYECIYSYYPNGKFALCDKDCCRGSDLVME